MRFKATTTLVLLAVMTVFGVAYLSLEVLKKNPTVKPTRVTLLLDKSGGLLPTSQVTMRGIQVGRVTGVQATPSGLRVSIDLDPAYPVPANSAISIQNLSLVGEQYIDFKTKHIAPPYFSDGAVIPADRVAPSVTVSELLAKANGLLSVINPNHVQSIVTTVSEIFAGNDATLDSLAITAGLVSKMELEKKQLLTTVFGNVFTLVDDLDAVHADASLRQAGLVLPPALLALTKLVRNTGEYTNAADGTFAPGAPVPTMVANINEYIDMLSGPLGTFATVLEPATEPLYGVRVNGGHWMDFWESTFNDAGGLRLQVNSPEGQ
ncbi:MCE family protein [Mycobacterium intermedium]|uniref:MCE family protein n=1 Tax=Mycobacterium intermedium TaxID=28445 RepID=A0A1E3SEW3_MYCIE|nr:MlaD family protein [Mycobacterium intermedium]MCV6965471.1 MCE family protein [Mycobacterium intermedium]ODR00602.1 mammalian cell entry protein [Mycobacterium intermedium]OPE51525.1 MCE family protein [Mycobacterium intermedium]ORB05749.1 MCE family protein [Mycobacterium intermedium]